MSVRKISLGEDIDGKTIQIPCYLRGHILERGMGGGKILSVGSLFNKVVQEFDNKECILD